MGEAILAGLREEAVGLLPTAIRLRRQLHASPEVGLRLPRTQALIVDELRSLGLEPRLGASLTSVTAVMGGARPGRTTVLRSDMDGLPLQESTGLAFASEVDGAMHACGHDVHMAMLLASAHLLVRHREHMAGRVVFVFQPGEEGFHGARLMLEEGLLEIVGDGPSSAFAAHVTTKHRAGTIATRPGPILAASDVFEIVVRGRGGHASAPHLALDPIPVAAEIVLALRAMVPRRIRPFDPVVITVGQLAAGTTHNIIPERALLQGTIRTFSEETRTTIKQQIGSVAGAIAAAHGLTVDVDIEAGYPATINDAPATELVQSIARATVGPGDLHLMQEPLMAAEDFSYVLQRIPGAFFFVGACPIGATPGEAPDTHSDGAIFEEDAMAAGIAVLAGLALRAP